MSRHARQSQRTEEGAVAVIVAMSMLALLLVAGLVLDFGQARTDKVTNKGFADSAAAAGIRANDGGDGFARPYRGVCAALAYLRTNPELATLPVWPACATGSASLDLPCVPNTTQASYSGTAGALSIQVKSGYKTPDPAFDPSGSPDNGSGDGCDQLAVFVTETHAPGLGSLATPNDIVTRVRTVARMTANTTSEAAVALLMLERTNCPAISVNSTNTKIEVKGFGTTPGSIHSDSLGNGPNCAANTKVLTGKFANGILARQAETGTPRVGGVITTVARSGAVGAVAANDTDGAANVCAEVGTGCVAATGRELVGRGLVDRRYLAGVRTAMATAATEYTRTYQNAGLPLAAGGGNYTVLGPAGCGNFGTSSNATRIFVDCPSGVSFNNTSFPNATDVVFNGPVTIKSTNTLSMPSAVHVYIKGVVGGKGLDSVGTLNVNTGGAAACSGQTTRASRVVIGNGSFDAGAQTSIRLCQTAVLMADSNGGSALVGTPPSTGATSLACPLPTPPVAGTGIAPYLNSCKGSINLGAGGTMDWSAPNLAVGRKATAAEQANLEDLALWTETSAQSKIGGSGTMQVSGVFFAPNSDPFTISGGATQSNGANAQFVARRLEAAGQGTLYMRPDPFNSITIPLPPTFSLVR